jgi:hypothetical protein
MSDFSNLSPEGDAPMKSFPSRVGEAHVSEEGITIYLKINYKVILLFVVILDFLHISISELVARFLGV